MYHQNDPNFAISCDLRDTCGVLYKTFSAYKAHIYRIHHDELHATNNQKQNGRTIPIENQLDDTAAIVGNALANENDSDEFDVDYDDPDALSTGGFYDPVFYKRLSLSNSVDADVEFSKSLANIERAYLCFLLQLREEYLLPKNVMHIISTYIVTLLGRIHELLAAKSFPCLLDAASSTSNGWSRINERLSISVTSSSYFI